MIEPLHVLLVAAPAEAEAALVSLRRVGYDPRPRIAVTPAAIGAALADRTWDVCVVASAGAQVAPLEVLGWTLRHNPRLPVFVLADAADEAVTLFEAGATDLISPSHVGRLGTAVARTRRQRSGPAEAPAPDAVAASTPIGMYRTSADGRILYANPAMARMLGHTSVEEVLGRAFGRDLDYPRDSFEARLREQQEIAGHEVSWTHPDGRTLVTREYARAVRDPEGGILYYEGTIEDVTDVHAALERERGRARAQERVLYYSALLDEAGDSAEVERIAAEGLAEVLAGPVVLVRSASGAAAPPAGGGPTLPLVHGDTALGAFQLAAEPPADRAELAALLVRRAAAALVAAESAQQARAHDATIRAIAGATGQTVYRRRTGSALCEVLSDAMEALTGYSAAAIKARGGLASIIREAEVLAGELPAGAEAGLADAPYRAVYAITARSGETRWLEDRTYPWIDEAGETVGLVGVLTDVTPQRRALVAERERQRRQTARQRLLAGLSMHEGPLPDLLRFGVEAAARLLNVERVAVWRRTPGTDILRCEVLWDRGRLGRSRVPPLRYEELGHGRLVLEAHRVYAVPDLYAANTGSAALDDHYAFNDIHALIAAPVRRHGEVEGFLAVEERGAPREWTEDEQEFAAALADLLALAFERHHRSRAERALRASEERYRAISEMASDYAFGLRVGRGGEVAVDWATKAFERVIGVSLEGYDSTTELVRAVVHPEDQGALLAAQERLYAGEAYEQTFRVIEPGTGGVRWVHHRSRPVLDAEGHVCYVYAAGRDVTERVEVEHQREETARQAREARDLAEATLRRKGAFVASMSHEIRTPLTGIIGFAEVLAEEVSPPHAEFAGTIAASGRRLLDTLNSVLDLARLESGAAAQRVDTVDLAAEVGQALEVLLPIARGRGLELCYEGPAALPARLDVTSLHRVVNNLVGNALKFTDTGAVTVTLRSQNGEATLAVADTGCGIAPAFLPYIFDEFRQEGEGIGRGREGSGLGLAITRDLLNLMGGRIAIESEQGVGSTFTVTLPLGLEPDPPAPQRPTFVSLAELFDDGEGDRPHDPSAQPDPPASPWTHRAVVGELALASASSGDGAASLVSSGARPRLLLAEDHDDTRQLLVRILSGAYEVVPVADARAALDQLSQGPFDLLLLDIHLGGRQTGADVLRVARTLPGHAHTPAVALTAHALPGDRERLLGEGFHGYVSKPFVAGEVRSALEEAAGAR